MNWATIAYQTGNQYLHALWEYNASSSRKGLLRSTRFHPTISIHLPSLQHEIITFHPSQRASLSKHHSPHISPIFQSDRTRRRPRVTYWPLLKASTTAMSAYIKSFSMWTETLIASRLWQKSNKHKVGGFVLFRHLSNPDAQHQVIWIEGGRMRPGARSHGAKYETIRFVTPLLQLVHARSKSCRFLASIDSYKKPLQRLFQTCINFH